MAWGGGRLVFRDEKPVVVLGSWDGGEPSVFVLRHQHLKVLSKQLLQLPSTLGIGAEGAVSLSLDSTAASFQLQAVKRLCGLSCQQSDQVEDNKVEKNAIVCQENQETCISRAKNVVSDVLITDVNLLSNGNCSTA